MLRSQKLARVTVECNENPNSLYQQLLRGAKRTECERGIITFNVTVTCPDEKKKKTAAKSRARNAKSQARKK